MSLEDLMSNADAMPAPDEIPELLVQLAAAQAKLASAHTRIAAAMAVNRSTNATPDRLLTVDEAAERLGVTAQWLYRRTRRLPFVVRQDGHVRFSAAGLARYIASKVGR